MQLTHTTLTFIKSPCGHSNITVIQSLNFPWLCKKGDYWLVWILNSHIHNICTTLIPSYSVESVIHYSDLIRDRTPATISVGQVIKSSSNETESLIIMYLNVERDGPSGHTKVSCPLHDHLGPNTKKQWLHTHTQENYWLKSSFRIDSQIYGNLHKKLQSYFNIYHVEI